MDNTTYELLKPDVVTAAKTAARGWPGIIDEDDAEQEIWLRLLEAGQSTLDKVAGMDRPLRVSSLSDIGHQIGARYRDDYELFSGNFRYGTQEVRKMLEDDALAGVHDGSVGPLWALPDTVIQQLTKTESMTVTERIDMMLGMKKLVNESAPYADMLVRVFVEGETGLDGSGRKELTRAVDALTRNMNRINLSVPHS